MAEAHPEEIRTAPAADPGGSTDGRDDGSVPAGRFSDWLVEVGRAIDGDQGSDVACGSCTACCTSSQFVHIGPDETDALAHIPSALTFPAPGLPAGHVLLGYDERGHCPMLVAGACSVYDHRPRTCRTYDCRVFPAAGLEPGEHQRQIGERTARWRFEIADDDDRARLDAVRAAARFLQDPASGLDPGLRANPTQLAVLAVEIHATFLRPVGETHVERTDPRPAEVRVAIERRTHR